MNFIGSCNYTSVVVNYISIRAAFAMWRYKRCSADGLPIREDWRMSGWRQERSSESAVIAFMTNELAVKVVS